MKISLDQLRNIIKEEVVNASDRFPKHNAMRNEDDDVQVLAMSCADAVLNSIEDDVKYLSEKGSTISFQKHQLANIHKKTHRLVVEWVHECLNDRDRKNAK